jgi:hypothetical protein
MEFFPRSTKSPLKTYGFFSEGRPFCGRRRGRNTVKPRLSMKVPVNIEKRPTQFVY